MEWTENPDTGFIEKRGRIKLACVGRSQFGGGWAWTTSRHGIVQHQGETDKKAKAIAEAERALRRT